MDIPQERKIVTEIPGPRTKEWIERRTSAVPSGVANLMPLVTERSSGAIVEDVDGNRFIDLATGIAVLNVGHTSPYVVDAIVRQAERETHTCFSVTMNEPYIELAEQLNRLIPIEGGDPKTFFMNSGAEAVENAVKVSRQHTRRDAVVVFDHAFHGRTLLTMSMTAKVMPYKRGFGPFASEIYRLPFAYPYRPIGGTATPEEVTSRTAAYAIDQMTKHIGTDNIACLVVEPIQGEGGFVVPSPGYLPTLREFCAQHGIVFVADEIQTGFGRTGDWFAVQHEGVEPDVMTTAKALGGGMPISAITGRPEIMDAAHVGGLGSTYGGNPVAAVAGLGVIEQIGSENLVQRSRELGATAMDKLRELETAHEVIGEVRGRGMMLAIELVADRSTKEPLDKAICARITDACMQQGVLVLRAGTYDNVIRLLPPLVIDEGLLLEGLDVLGEAIGAATA
ncbi:MAG: 4-aminobutyrate--2-oxoglutarate transaminase [Actinomycetota bacterium]